jgi:small nuclear ribonucleoprotein (snRNP)-like protein
MKPRPIPRYKRSLSFALSSLQGVYGTFIWCCVKWIDLLSVMFRLGNEVVIELRDDSEVRGYIDSVTASMDVLLCHCHHTLANSEERTMEQMIIKGTSIRYVHIPKSTSVLKNMSDFVRKLEFNERRSVPSKIRDKPPSSKSTG